MTKLIFGGLTIPEFVPKGGAGEAVFQLSMVEMKKARKDVYICRENLCFSPTCLTYHYMTTLKEIITQYGSLENLPAVGDKVLFERGDDSGSFSINLGTVTAIRPEGEFKVPTALVQGLHAFYPDGTNKPFRGRVPYGFPLSHFKKSIGERLAAQAEARETYAAAIRAWVASLDR